MPVYTIRALTRHGGLKPVKTQTVNTTKENPRMAYDPTKAMNSAVEELIANGILDGPAPTTVYAAPTPYTPAVPVDVSEIDKLVMSLPAYRRFDLQMAQGPGAALVGPAGSFKSSIIGAWARANDYTPYQLTCFPNMQVDDLVGRYIDTAGTFKDGMLPRSYKDEGKPVLILEEMNLAHPGMATRLNTISDGLGRPLEIAETGETIAHNANWRVCAAYNEGTQYGGTRDTNTAFINRLGPIWTPYPDEKVETKLLSMFLGDTGAIAPDVNVAMKIAKMTRGLIPTLDLSVRPLLRFVRQVRAGLSWREAAEGIMDLVGVPELTGAERKILSDQVFPQCLPK